MSKSFGCSEAATAKVQFQVGLITQMQTVSGGLKLDPEPKT